MGYKNTALHNARIALTARERGLESARRRLAQKEQDLLVARALVEMLENPAKVDGYNVVDRETGEIVRQVRD